MTDLDALRYPVGRMVREAAPLTPEAREAHLRILETTPARFRALAAGLSETDLERTYRPGGWTLRQVFHHVPDSHLHVYIRMKWAVTEDLPQVKTYDEERWAELGDSKRAPIEMSLGLLESLHARWVAFLRALPPADWRRGFLHPELGTVTIDEALVMYSWHCRHHTAHIEIGKRG